MRNRRVVITGIGPISSIGIGKDALWKSVLTGKANIKKQEVSLDGEPWGNYFVHKVDDFDISRFSIDKDKLQRIKDWKEGEEIIDLNYLIAAIKLALDDSKIDYSDDNNGISLVLAHENLGLMPLGFKMSDLAYEMLVGRSKENIIKKDFFTKFYNSFIKSGYDIQVFADLFHIAQVFNTHQYSIFLNNACASGLYSLEAASDIIKSGKSDVAVVAISDYPDMYKYIWFRDLGIYSSDGLIRPFCKDSNGLAFGDGGVAIVVEDLAHAKKRKAPLYAEYLGGGFDLEGWKITVPQIGSKSYHRAIEMAFKRARVKKYEVDVLCPHGVGSQPIDYYESKAITDTFGANPKKPLISTFKPYVGHNLGGSALLETAILLLALKNDVVPQTLNYNNPDPKFNIPLVKEQTVAKLKTAMKICCAFAGYNAAALFRKLN